MGNTRRYRLLCPIARALDHVGDRWTLLVLRDLHAGPARFTDLQNGLAGIASNLLADRLRALEADGLVRRRRAEFGVTVYELTEFGETTGALLFELAALGSRFRADEDVHSPGNLRSIAVTLKESLRRVVDPSTNMTAGLLVGDEAFEITIADGDVAVLDRSPMDVDVTIATQYEPFMSVADGAISLEDFVANHVEIVDGNPDAVARLLPLLAGAITCLTGASELGPVGHDGLR